MPETTETPQPCPCKDSLTEGDKKVVTFGMDNINDLLKNPNAAATSAAKEALGSNFGRIESLLALASDPQGTLSSALPALDSLKQKMQSQMAIVDAFDAESKKFSDPKQLMSMVSSLNMMAEINCALGIEGVDVTAGFSVANNNGQMSMNFALNANVDVSNLMDKMDGGINGNISDALGAIEGGLGEVMGKLDEANNAMNKVMAEASAMQNAAADLIEKYTTVNMITNLVNQSEDSCFKLGSNLTGNIISPEFVDVVRGNTPAGGF